MATRKYRVLHWLFSTRWFDLILFTVERVTGYGLRFDGRTVEWCDVEYLCL